MHIAQRRKIISDNLAGGMNMVEITEALASTPYACKYATVRRDVMELLKQWREHHVEMMDSYVHVELRRDSVAMNAIFDKVGSGDLDAIKVMLKIQERVSKYLGLDKVEKAQIAALASPEMQSVLERLFMTADAAGVRVEQLVQDLNDRVKREIQAGGVLSMKKQQLLESGPRPIAIEVEQVILEDDVIEGEIV